MFLFKREEIDFISTWPTLWRRLGEFLSLICIPVCRGWRQRIGLAFCYQETLALARPEPKSWSQAQGITTCKQVQASWAFEASKLFIFTIDASIFAGPANPFTLSYWYLENILLLRILSHLRLLTHSYPFLEVRIILLPWLFLWAVN